MNELELFISQVKEIEIETPEQVKAANELTKAGKKIEKQIKDKWKPIKDEANKKHKEATQGEKEELKPIQEALTMLKNAIASFQKKEQEKLLELQRQKEEELKAIQEMEMLLDGVITTTQTETVEATKIEGFYMKKTWHARVTDPSKVPSHHKKMALWKVDEEALDRIAKAEGANHPDIEGVEFYYTETPVVRG